MWKLRFVPEFWLWKHFPLIRTLLFGTNRTVILTFFNDEGTLFGLGGRFAQAAHVLWKDPEKVLVSNHQLCDGDAVAMVVLNARVPLLWSKSKLVNIKHTSSQFQFSILRRIDLLPLSSCLLFEWCSLLSGHCRCLLEESRPEQHFLPKHLRL